MFWKKFRREPTSGRPIKPLLLALCLQHSASESSAQQRWGLHLTHSPLEGRDSAILRVGIFTRVSNCKPVQNKMFLHGDPLSYCFPLESLPVLHWRMNKEHLQASLLDIHNCLRQWSFNVSGSLDQQKLQRIHLNMYYYYARYGEINKFTWKSCENQIQIFIRKYISNCMLSKQFFLGMALFSILSAQNVIIVHPFCKRLLVLSILSSGITDESTESQHFGQNNIDFSTIWCGWCALMCRDKYRCMAILNFYPFVVGWKLWFDSY